MDDADGDAPAFLLFYLAPLPRVAAHFLRWRYERANGP